MQFFHQARRAEFQKIKTLNAQAIAADRMEYVIQTVSSLSRADFAKMCDNAVSKLATIKIGNAREKFKNPRSPCRLIDITKAPRTMAKMAAHWPGTRLSPKVNTANIATNTGNVCKIADALDASSSL